MVCNMTKNREKAWEGTSLDFLEGIGGTVPQLSAGNAALSADLEDVPDDLESINVRPQLAEITQYQPPQPTAQTEEDEVAEKGGHEELINEIDVRLNDIINKFFSSSERLVVIISDDQIAYANPVALGLLEAEEKDVKGQNFFSFVDEKDWSALAENIGVMLTDGKTVEATLKSKNNKSHKITLEAIYLPDTRHFSFIMIGKEAMSIPKKDDNRQVSMNLYDPVTGLPSFYLFEDRVQMAVNFETYKDARLRKNMVAVIAVSIDNIFTLQQQGVADFILKKLASKLVFSLRKNYTVSRGIAYQFWILMNDISSVGDLDIELRKIHGILSEGISDNFTEHSLITSIGVSVFPLMAPSAKKLLEQTIKATKKSQEKGGGISVFSEDEKTENRDF